MTRFNYGKELNFIRRQYTNKCKFVKENLRNDLNDLIDWNTAEVVITDGINFGGDVHIQVNNNITNKQMNELVTSIEYILKENKVGLYCTTEIDYAENTDTPYFSYDDVAEITLYNESLYRRCKDYLFAKLFNAYFRKIDNQEVYYDIFLDELYDNPDDLYFVIQQEFTLDDTKDFENKLKTMSNDNIEYMIIDDTVIEVDYKHRTTVKLCDITDIDTYSYDAIEDELIIALDSEDKYVDTIILTKEGAEI